MFADGEVDSGLLDTILSRRSNPFHYSTHDVDGRRNGGVSIHKLHFLAAYHLKLHLNCMTTTSAQVSQWYGMCFHSSCSSTIAAGSLDSRAVAHSTCVSVLHIAIPEPGQLATLLEWLPGHVLHTIVLPLHVRLDDNRSHLHVGCAESKVPASLPLARWLLRPYEAEFPAVP